MQSAPGHFPKILFVNDFRPDSLHLADLVRQLLLGYPSEQIAWWYCRESGLRPPADLRAGSLHRWRMPGQLVPQRRLTSLKSFLLERFWVPLAARHLRHTIAAVKPDLVWVLLYGWPILVARQAGLAGAARRHVSLWDYPDQASGQRILGPDRSRRFVEAINDCLRCADSYDGISAAVLEEVTRTTGKKDGLLVHSGFEPSHLQALEQAPAAARDEVVRLAYVGTIISEKAFLEMLSVLERIRTAGPRPVVLEFFGGRGYRHRPWFDPQWMSEHGVFSDDELIRSLQRCDWGITVMDPEGEDLRYSRFSFPNKIGTYLSAGVPVLGLGHPQSSLAQVMNSYRVGKFTSAVSRDALKTFLEECLRIEQPRMAFRADILQCARTEFNAPEIRRRLWKAWGVAV